MKFSKGFTLLEVSLVLVVLAVIVSLATYGGSLLKQAETKSLITELSQFQQIIDAFKDRYSSLPGDYPNAYATFGSSCAASASECNGDGDGIIEWSNSTTDVESLRAWQHLYLADFFNINLSGTATTSGQSDIDRNIPRSSWPNAGFELYVEATTQTGQTGNGIQVAGFTSSSWAHSATIMTTKDAWNIDKKIDDGIGQKGKILGFNFGSNSACVGTDNLTYNLTLEGKVCYIRYLLYPEFN